MDSSKVNIFYFFYILAEFKKPLRLLLISNEFEFPFFRIELGFEFIDSFDNYDNYDGFFL